ncbi:MAG: GtrA family protein [Planctomycetes bacterium]|nr:GtrA family protein [Planctomycetota bacterium]
MFVALKLKRWVADPVESIFMQVPRALAASVLALAVDFILLELCIRLVGMSAVPAAILGYLAGGVLQYVLCSVWVFSTSLKSDAAGFLVFTVLSLVGLGITWIVVLVAHDWAGLPVEIAKVGAVGLAFTWNFLSRKYLLFRNENAIAK